MTEPDDVPASEPSVVEIVLPVLERSSTVAERLALLLLTVLPS
ncbi:MAG TPA: hypothetical protein VGX25_03380 [Actinophytocola sp.]|nr:hypothetical protein [Actinophytocola sp.]HEV2778421.1 hypothetical protein [Actinophytocola sp.]